MAVKKLVLQSVAAGLEAMSQLQSPHALAFMERVGQLLAATFERGGKVLIAGNGGSLCDAMHFAEELTGFFRQKRPALPAIALSDPGHLSCVGNDAGFDQIFARGVEAYGKPGDCFVGLSTSGNSPNVIRAVEAAQSRELSTVAFLGRDGGRLQGVADHELIIQGHHSDRIQEAHMCAIHIIIELIEAHLFDGQEQEVPSHSLAFT